MYSITHKYAYVVSADIIILMLGVKKGIWYNGSFLEWNIETKGGRSKKNHVGLKLNGTHQLLVYEDDVNLLGDNIDTIKKTWKL
jgi:hypothetical protein